MLVWFNLSCMYWIDDDIIKWKHFLRYWPCVWGIHRSLVNSLHKGKWCWALMFSLICAWINGWGNSREAGDLRHHHAHYDVSVMYHLVSLIIVTSLCRDTPAVSTCEVLSTICCIQLDQLDSLLPHCSQRQNGQHFGDDNLSNWFNFMKIVVFFKFHWNLFLSVLSTISQHWFK